MNVNKAFLWGVAVAVFVVCRSIISEFFSEGTVVAALIYSMLIALIIIPYVEGRDIRIPPGHLLVRGEDDFSRLLSFIISVVICISAISAP